MVGVKLQQRRASFSIAVIFSALALLFARHKTRRLGGLRPLIHVLLTRFQEVNKGLPPELKNALLGTLYMSFVGAVGGVCYQLYWMVSNRIRAFCELHCQVSMSITNADKQYDVVIDYIGTKCAVETGRIMASTKRRKKRAWSEQLAEYLGGKHKAPVLYFQPDLQSFGNYFVWKDHEGQAHEIWADRWVDDNHALGDKKGGTRIPETLTLTLWWTQDSTPLKEFMQDAMESVVQAADADNKVDIYVKSQYESMWTKAISRDKRDRDTIVLDDSVADHVIEDMRNFFTQATADWYHNAGIPYRRGYLLYGPPGCGKTSFAQVLAGEIGLDICLLNLSNQDLDDDDLAELLRMAPARSMLLLEDVDAIFVERAAGREKRNGVSFSGLLNALDGSAAQEGCVIVLTTNHKDRLDEALIRPGRCDLHVCISKASQNQAQRMFYRFFTKPIVLKSTDSRTGLITCKAAHGLLSGEAVMYKGKFGEALRCEGKTIKDEHILYARVPIINGNASKVQLYLYESEECALSGGDLDQCFVTDVGTGMLQCLLEAATRFSSRIPEGQVSMAKLQGYLMQHKLIAERSVKAQQDNGELIPGFEYLSNEDQLLCCEAEIVKYACESAVMNVHQLLDAKVETEEIKLPLFDHFRRIGLHRYTPFFEHFGIRLKQDLRQEVVSNMEHWHPDLQIEGPLRARFEALIDEESGRIDPLYRLADLSVLKDQFMASYQHVCGIKDPCPRVILSRSKSEPSSAEDEDHTRLRFKLLSQSKIAGKVEEVSILEMAHKFQEKLESNGKTDVTMWQLAMHFQRYQDDPIAALENCEKLVHTSENRTVEEYAVPWLSTFVFLRRLGLEEHAFALEDEGFKFWSDLKAMEEEKLKTTLEESGLSEKQAEECHAVLTADKERPELLRKFMLPEFPDIVAMFHLRFPAASKSTARSFAREITDELGLTEFSCLQVDQYLKNSKSVQEALNGTAEGLKPGRQAEAERTRPDDDSADESESETWLCKWLKAEGLEELEHEFEEQALETRTDVIDASLDADTLEKIGVKRLGQRVKLLRMVQELKGTEAVDEAPDADEHNSNKSLSKEKEEKTISNAEQDRSYSENPKGKRKKKTKS